MSVTLPKMRDVLSLFPSTAYIAGSAAVRPQQADDIDIFLTNIPAHEGILLPEQLNLEIKWLSAALKPGIISECAPVANYANSNNMACYEGHYHDTLIHVILSIYPCIVEILDHFDVSCHAWAVNLEGKIEKAPWSTFPGWKIRQGPNIYPNALNTAKRIEEFTKRYQWITKMLMDNDAN